MGLVSTWLNGIGLRSVVPTFEAAGIVSPAHLADLDVSYFESLGVTDPDDRRKLFYLVQRIKLAVNKKDAGSKATSPTAEERVDAVVSKDFGSENDDPKGTEILLSEEKKMDTEPLRRSKRIIAKKKTTKVVSSKKTNDSVKTSTASPTKRTASVQRKGKDGTDKNPQSSPRLGSPLKKDRMKSPSSSPRKLGSPMKSASNNIVKEKKERTVPRIPSLSSKSSIPSASSAAVGSGNDRTTRRTDFSGEICHSPTRRQNPESKLPVSKLAGKRYSTRASDTITTESTSSDSSSSHSNNQTMELPTIQPDTSKLKSRRATLAGNFDALGNTFQSARRKNQANDEPESTKGNSNPSAGAESTTKRSGSGNIPRFTTSRSSKSMGVSETAVLQQYQRNSKRTSMLPARNTRVSTTTATTATNKTQSDPPPSTNVFVQGASETSDSWGAKIGYLREDNEAEHELFRDEIGNESQYHEYYDMRIKVIVRKRPMSKSECFSGGIDIIHPLDYGDYGKTLVYQPKTRVDLTREIETVPFAFDNVFDETSTNLGIYNRSLRNLVEPFFEGQWATVFAYGQTGSGKTYTMMGSNITGINAGTAKMDESNLGLYYLAALDIFEMMKLPEYSHLNVRISLFEIYGGKLFDLLNDRQQIKCLEDRKGKVCFPGLTEHPAHAPEHVMQFIEQGSENRSTGSTSRNADSSRSHAVLQIKLVKNAGRNKNVEHGRFSFIDLAGNERGADTNNASKATRLEGAEINTSLLALKEVIRALATGGSMTHIPFRGSKLTQVLKDSFVGENSRCCMVACISPDIGNCEQTLNTLRYADRVKERNPETGVLPKSCEQPIRMSSFQPSGQAPSNKSSQRESANHQKNYLDDISVGEDELSDSFHQGVQNEILPQSSDITEKEKAGQALIASHRSVMTRWLALVKDEMKMVNQVDADREGLEDYILQLQNVQRAQIDFLSELRGSLQSYVTAAEGPHQTGVDQGFDDSFEDLRD